MNCKQILTFSANGKTYEKIVEIPVTSEADEARHLESDVLNIYPDITYQTIDGFGAAMTETSAYLFSKMDDATRKSAMEAYFGKYGNQISFLRVHMDSCDYSLEEYTAVEDPMTDPEFETFSLKRDRQYILPVLKEALAMSVQPISVLLSPWSPPACWKTPPHKPKNDASVYGALESMLPPIDYETPSRNNGGSLKPEFYGQWAKYLTKFVQAYLDEGIPVTMMSIQNESIAATMWDSCVWTAAEQKTFLKDFLYPAFVAAGLTEKVGIYIWDHNKERVLEYARDIIDETTNAMVEGIAFHWYSGDHFEAVEMATKVFPDKVMMLSECCGLHKPGRVGFGDGLFVAEKCQKPPDTVENEDAAAYAHDSIGNLNAGMHRWIDWNLCVDLEGGPRHVPGGFTAGMIVDDAFAYRTNLTYTYIGHFSKYILPGAVRIGFSRCDDGIEMTAAKNPDGSVVAVILNKTNEDRAYAIRMMGQIIRVQAPARTLGTLCINA